MKFLIIEIDGVRVRREGLICGSSEQTDKERKNLAHLAFWLMWKFCGLFVIS
jgi:hypothetical protein